jgi:hypothetical protein
MLSICWCCPYAVQMLSKCCPDAIFLYSTVICFYSRYVFLFIIEEEKKRRKKKRFSENLVLGEKSKKTQYFSFWEKDNKK